MEEMVKLESQRWSRESERRLETLGKSLLHSQSQMLLLQHKLSVAAQAVEQLSFQTKTAYVQETLRLRNPR